MAATDLCESLRALLAGLDPDKPVTVKGNGSRERTLATTAGQLTELLDLATAFGHLVDQADTITELQDDADRLRVELEGYMRANATLSRQSSLFLIEQYAQCLHVNVLALALLKSVTRRPGR